MLFVEAERLEPLKGTVDLLLGDGGLLEKLFPSGARGVLAGLSMGGKAKLRKGALSFGEDLPEILLRPVGTGGMAPKSSSSSSMEGKD